ncbi:hypothetical protein M2451_002345 [Dysgonomonas sp. PFB1-18]|uniref:hypothetical protein n=1 Tax=unclassified Dysgonomonas TaxID=2630389 RepID=UPI00247304A7|nr:MULTISPECIES: hypothetical protein [unclassified Dysgonomonas]MDH6307111.1 hypothetical protein [Dysgonomonas sp. PF1-14]MDH6337030.1 hypothetical protein [Dysgonomonas sp. PF1-16]MDH6381016.1 hypothetical protein [Dysgonomonas sp. PFB1-18]MDH6396405.1 hypothetical protein [Dysgonomonas sp. PF1-23]
MNRIRKSPKYLSVPIKGMIFAFIIMFFSTSCCITGYCQMSTADVQQEKQETTK